MQVIQNLQQNRSQIVHMFDDLVTQLPKGVYYDQIQKRDKNLNIRGLAQSNERVSALMRNLDASDWFDASSLKQVDVVDKSGLLISQFVIDVKEQNKDGNNNGAEDVR